MCEGVGKQMHGWSGERGIRSSLLLIPKAFVSLGGAAFASGSP